MRSRFLAIAFLAARLHAGEWIGLAPLLEPRQEIAVAAANGRVFAIGGIGDAVVLTSVEAYDPATDRWNHVAPLPEPLHHSAAVTVDDRIYVIGGYRTLAFDATDVVYRYDPFADRWSAVA